VKEKEKIEKYYVLVFFLIGVGGICGKLSKVNV
jgi:hypothetical protein